MWTKEQKNKYQKKWREANPEKLKLYEKKYYQIHPEKKIKIKKWREANPEKLKSQKREWRANNIERVKQYYNKWCNENPQNIKKYNESLKLKIPDSYIIKRFNSNFRKNIVDNKDFLNLIRHIILIKRELKKQL